MIKDNILKIKAQISMVCKRLGRNPDEITLIGVTKFAPVQKIEEAIEGGLSDVAENKVQEGQKKYLRNGTPDSRVTKHLIGHLQTNKAKDALKIFDLIQSVDSLKLALEIQKQAEKLNKEANILVQVNTAEEEQKYGTTSEDAIKLIEEILKLKNVNIKGFMAMAPFTEDKGIARRSFSKLREISEQAKKQFSGDFHFECKYLSMGMSNDYGIALEEGSNMVRIGRAIFTDS